MLKKAPYFILLLALGVFVYSCSKKAKQELKKSEVFTHGKPVLYEIEENAKFATVEVYEEIKPFLENIKKNYDSVHYFCDLDTNFFFYVQNGKRKGVVDKNGKLIIPLVYSKIYNPGGTVKNFIEVEKGNKRGLYDFQGNIIVPIKYNEVYPVNYDDVLVQVKLDTLFGYVTKDGIEVFDTTGLSEDKYFKSPYANKMAQEWAFDVNTDNVLFLQPVGYTRIMDDPIDGRAVVFTPSYLMKLGLFPEMVDRIIMEKEADFGIAESKGKVKEVKGLWDNIMATFAEYYEVGLDARGYETEKNNLVTVNQLGEIIGKAELFKPFMPQSPCGKDGQLFTSKFIDSSLFEVKTYIYSWQDESIDTTYDTYDLYYYYSIKANGEITKLKNNRRFASTKYVLLNKNYLQGCFANIALDEYGSTNNSDVRTHLSLKDLEEMKNEIYADYGYIFTDAKWRSYFKKKSWYKAKLSSIEPIITEVDKHNIAFIDTVIEDMQANPDAYNETSKGTIYILP